MSKPGDINPLLSEAGKAVYDDVAAYAAEHGISSMPKAFMMYGRAMAALTDFLQVTNAVVLPEVETALARWAAYLSEKTAKAAISRGES